LSALVPCLIGVAATAFEEVAAGEGSISELLSRRPHTHHAADGGQEQADLFNNIFAWAIAGGRPD
jgi:hypothetical protein